ncbi:MAG: hydrogenase maturation protease [Thermoguttaceae bacterium]|jgi:hydrogenase maturation protease
MEPSPRVLILGIGNLLMGDEGLGVHAIRILQEQTWPAGVELVDGGTGGFNLLSYLSDYPTVILIDAVMDGRDPGKVTIIKPQFLSDYPRTLAAHDVGLRDLIETAALLGPLPVMYLITVSIAEIREGATELTPAIEQALADVVRSVRNILCEEGFPPERFS